VNAIALALRFNPLFFTYKTILDKAGIFLKFFFKREGQEDSDDRLWLTKYFKKGNRRNKIPGFKMATRT